MPYNCPHCEKPNEDAVPRSRFDEVYSERRALKAELADAQSAAADASTTATNAEELTAKLADLESRFATQGDAHARAVAVMGAGVSDPEDVADLLAIFDRRAPEGVSVSDWLAERDSLPRSAAALLTSPATETPTAVAPVAAATETPAATAAPLATPPRADAGAIPHTAAPGAFTPESISHMSLDEYREKRAAIKASLG
jgi:hypothetical protein